MHAFFAALGLDRMDIFVAVGAMFAMYVLLRLTKSSVSPQGFQEVASVLNTKGGNVLVLAGMSMFFFAATIWLAFIIIQDIKAGTLREDNAIALMALQFCMNSAFSACLGAMLKTMTGESPTPPPSGTEEQTTKTTKTVTHQPPNATNTLTATGAGETTLSL